jgi:hypothetical protein
MLIYHGTSATTDEADAWAALSPEEQEAVARD